MSGEHPAVEPIDEEFDDSEIECFEIERNRIAMKAWRCVV